MVSSVRAVTVLTLLVAGRRRRSLLLTSFSALAPLLHLVASSSGQPAGKKRSGCRKGKQCKREEMCRKSTLRYKASIGESESGLKPLTTKIRHSEKELKEKKTQMKRDKATAAEKELATTEAAHSGRVAPTSC